VEKDCHISRVAGSGPRGTKKQGDEEWVIGRRGKTHKEREGAQDLEPGKKENAKRGKGEG